MKLIHFSGLEKNLNCSKYNNIILSWNSDNNYIKDFKNKEIFYVAKFWQKNLYKVKNKVINFKKRLFPNLCKELNLVNNIDYSNKEWEILLEPWLNLYLETNYFRWLLINELTKIHKNFDYLEANLIFKTLRDFSKNIYKIFLFQKYEFYINESSSNFFTKLGSELIILQTYLISSVVFITESIILTFLTLFLLVLFFM